MRRVSSGAPDSVCLRAIAAEGLGSLFLSMAVIGSGIMAERLSGGNDAIALLANTLATSGALIALVLCFQPYSGAQFNPAVTLALAMRPDFSTRRAAVYATAQCIGAISGVAAAHFMFGLPLLAAGIKARGGFAPIFAEFVASFGLIAVVWSLSRHRPRSVAYGVGAYIAGAYWFTASTSFANPALTLARALTPSFSGLRPADAPGFVAAEFAGAALVAIVFRWLDRDKNDSGKNMADSETERV